MKNLDFDIYKPNNKLSLEKGRLLISEPLTNDVFFSRTVVLLAEHSKKGSVGFVLNKTSKYTLSDVFHEDFLFNPFLNLGGPVGDDTLHFIHKLGNSIPGAKQIIPNLYMDGNIEVVKIMARNGTLSDNNIRFFIGLSGWSYKQLDGEIDNDFWQIIEYFDNIAMDFRSKNDWKDLLANIGNKYKHWANVPEDPILN